MIRQLLLTILVLVVVLLTLIIALAVFREVFNDDTVEYQIQTNPNVHVDMVLKSTDNLDVSNFPHLKYIRPMLPGTTVAITMGGSESTTIDIDGIYMCDADNSLIFIDVLNPSATYIPTTFR